MTLASNLYPKINIWTSNYPRSVWFPRGAGKRAERVVGRKWGRKRKLDAPWLEGAALCLKCDQDRMKKEKGRKRSVAIVEEEERRSVVSRRGRDKPSSRNLRTSWRWGRRQWASGEIFRNKRSQGQRVVRIATGSGYTANPIAQCSRWRWWRGIPRLHARFPAALGLTLEVPKLSDITAKCGPLVQRFVHLTPYRETRVHNSRRLAHLHER